MTLYAAGRYRVRYSPLRDAYIVALAASDTMEIYHSSYPHTDDGLLLAKACADLQSQLERDLT